MVGTRNAYLLCGMISFVREWAWGALGAWGGGYLLEEILEGFLKEGALGCTSEACKTEKARREAQGEGTAYEKSWGHGRMLSWVAG